MEYIRILFHDTLEFAKDGRIYAAGLLGRIGITTNSRSGIPVTVLLLAVSTIFLSFIIKKLHSFIYQKLYGIYWYEPDLQILHEYTKDKLAWVKKHKIPDNNIHKNGVPAAVPNGWYYVCLSNQLQKNQVKHFSFANNEVAVFRDEYGHIYALDAYCPHTGANMAIAGSVKGSCLECPFHAWKFDGADGKCVNIPGAKRIPEIAKVNTWNVLERNKLIMLWYDAEDREPQWTPCEITEIHEENWEPLAHGTHYVNAHISEVPENGADIAHFVPVHARNALYGSSLRETRAVDEKHAYLDHHWTEPYWEQSEDWFMAQGGLRHDMKVFGENLKCLTTFTTFKQFGPGIVHLQPITYHGIKLLLVMTVTPVDTFKQRIVHIAFAQHTVFGKLKAMFALRAEGLMFERDVTLWNNKVYRPQSVFAATKADELLLKFRRWFSQFYSENSTTKQSNTTDLTW